MTTPNSNIDSASADSISPQISAQLDLTCQLAQTVGWPWERVGNSVVIAIRDDRDVDAAERGMRAHMSTVLDLRLVTATRDGNSLVVAATQ
jgi:hypothetical protein